MCNTEQFYAWWVKEGTFCDNPFTSKKETAQSAFNAGAESKQAELDKANARIAQLEEGLTLIAETDGTWDEYIAMAAYALAYSPATWLLEHDKAAKQKILEQQAVINWASLMLPHDQMVELRVMYKDSPKALLEHDKAVELRMLEEVAFVFDLIGHSKFKSPAEEIRQMIKSRSLK